MHSENPFYLKIFHFLPIPFVLAICIILIYLYTEYFVLQQSLESIFLMVLPILFTYFCSTMTLINFVLTISTSPGKVERNWEKTQDPEKDSEIKGKKKEFYCKFCAMKRPERSHHCKVCKMCVLKMDHHCPWVANCVGFWNQKYFYLFLFYSTLATFFISISLLTRLGFSEKSFNKNSENVINNSTFSLNKTNSTLNNSTGSLSIFSVLKDQSLILFGCLLAGIVCLAIGVLLVVQTNLLIKNLTTIETRIYKIKEENPFYSPNKILSLSIVLGFNKWKWFFPSFEKNIFNNGFSFLKPDPNLISNKKENVKQQADFQEKNQFHKLPNEADLSDRSSI